MKNILITSGGTREYIDDIRVMTNISSGKLGALIADEFIMNYPSSDGLPGCHIHFVYAKGSEKPKHGIQSITFYEVTDVRSTYELMERIVPNMDVVIHPMAVSDFGFRPIETKLKSNDPEAFIESLRERIYKTPKILGHIKGWNPKCFLISFKFEDNLELFDLLQVASHSMMMNGSDVVVANDKAEMKKLGIHRAYFLYKVKIGDEPTFNDVKFVDGKENISKQILKIVIDNGNSKL
jgi:phosphopantothenate---cysteine ligase (CTP)